MPAKISHIVRVTVMSAAVLVLSGAGVRQSDVVAAQHTGGGSTGAGGVPTGLPPVDAPATGVEPNDEMRARMEHEREKAVNDDRQKRLAADVDRLVELTNELKADVNKTTKDELSVDVIKKAQEIEKLAHDVQSRMKQ